MTIRGGGNPHTAMATMPLGEWTRRLGALPAEAYDCFMVGTLCGFNRIQAWFARDCSWPMAGSPRIISWQITRSRAACRRARVGQGQAFGGAEEAPSLTLAARDGDSNIGRDGRMLATRVEKKNEATAQTVRYGTLDNESPIQAVCGKAARTVLCGGRSVTSVPTASGASSSCGSVRIDRLDPWLGRPEGGQWLCRRGDLVSQRREEPNTLWRSSFDWNEGEYASSSYPQTSGPFGREACRGAGAAGGDSRDSEDHQHLADRAPVRVGGRGQECRALLQGRRRYHFRARRAGPPRDRPLGSDCTSYRPSHTLRAWARGNSHHSRA